MFEKEKREILGAALEIRRCNLISLSGGNVSMRADENPFLVVPPGTIYEEMTADDMVVIDQECEMAEGMRKPSSDSPALVYMSEHVPHISALTHTHQPYATVTGFVADQIPEFPVTPIDANEAMVNMVPFTPSSDIGAGIMTVKYVGKLRAVILKHYGITAYEADMKGALYSAIYLEKVTKTSVLTKAMGVDIPLLVSEDIIKEKRGWLDYGQQEGAQRRGIPQGSILAVYLPGPWR